MFIGIKGKYWVGDVGYWVIKAGDSVGEIGYEVQSDQLFSQLVFRISLAQYPTILTKF